VALPGVQVLFAFLLTVPFTGRFSELSTLQTAVFTGAFLATGVSSILLMAPSAYHRIRFRDGDEERMLRTSNRWALAGLGFLATGLVLVVYLVADLVAPAPLAIVAGLAAAGLALGLWFALPLSRRRDDGA
jgi:Flp pilus assembly protein TadB